MILRSDREGMEAVALRTREKVEAVALRTRGKVETAALRFREKVEPGALRTRGKGEAAALRIWGKGEAGALRIRPKVEAVALRSEVKAEDVDTRMSEITQVVATTEQITAEAGVMSARGTAEVEDTPVEERRTEVTKMRWKKMEKRRIIVAIIGSSCDSINISSCSRSSWTS